MTVTLTPGEWLRVIQQEYLDSFISDGGSAVKFAVPLGDETRQHLFRGLEDSASTRGYLVLKIDAAVTRVHLAQQIFFRAAAQVRWQELVQRVVSNIIRGASLTPPADGPEPFAWRIVKANPVNSDLVQRMLIEAIGNNVFKRSALTRDFRTAMTRLCKAEITGGADDEMAVNSIIAWLTGENPYISAVKPYFIYSRIGRTNARYLFESLTSWVKYAGYAGTTVIVDTSRVTVAKNPRDGGVYYTKASVLDTYEVLRQFIDGMDRLTACLVVVAPDQEFLDEEGAGRGYGAYEALKLRVIDEVRDRNLVNPMASLVRLAERPSEALT